MTETANGDLPNRALLPAGLKDVLPPTAAHEAARVEDLLAVFAARGYERVKPPLIEFEAALLSGAGASLAPQTFRLMDPASHHMLALRPDMTTQVARIATTRLARAPRPLRLCYAGQVLRVRGTQMRPERQFAQAGAELVGSDAPAADAEVAVMALDALAAVGITGVSLDLTLPPLAGALARHLGLAPARSERLRAALDRKDAAAVAELAGPHARLFGDLLRAAGPAETALARLRALDLPAALQGAVRRLDAVQDAIRAARPEATVTVDPVEHRGFEYQSGVSFALYARGVRGELGRGGRYTANGDGGEAEAADADTAESGTAGEPAAGFTLFLDTLLRAVAAPRLPARVYLPHGTDAAAAARLRAAGWVTLAGLTPVPDPAAEARRLGCGHWLDGERIAALAPADDTDATS